MVNLHVSLVSPRIILSFTKKIRENPRDTQEVFPIHPPLPPPFSHPELCRMDKREHGLLVTLFRFLPLVRGG